MDEERENIPDTTGTTPDQPSEDEIAERDAMAQFKLGLISSVVFHTHDKKSDREELMRIAGKAYMTPEGRTRQYSYQTLCRYAREYKAMGIAGLWTKKRTDSGNSRVLREEVITRMMEIIKEIPSIRIAKLGRRLVKEGVLREGEVSDDTLRRYVNNHGLRNPAVVEVRIRRSFIVKEIGYLWVSDSLYLIKLKRNSKLHWVFVQAIIDDHSRMILSAKCYWNDNAINFQDTFRYAVGRFHIPVKLFVDNGSPFIDRQLISICNRLGVSLIHTRSNDGASKGVIERSWLSMLIDTIPDIILDKVDTIEGVQEVIDKYVEYYNTRVNTGVGGIPIERYRQSEKRIALRTVASSDELSRMFMNESPHLVYNDNTIRKWGKKWEISDDLVVQLRKDKARYVNVYYDPHNREETMYIRYKEKEYVLTLHDPEANDGKPRNTGGRKSELAERAKNAAEEKMSLADQRAEERYARRMVGVDPRYLEDTDDLPFPETPEGNDVPGDLTIDYT